MIGQTISHYTILQKQGEGGRGVVYKAEDTRLKRTVALKLLPPEFMRDAQAKERFLQEAQAAAALDHPNICNIHQIEEAEEKIFIVMSFVQGENLKEKITAAPFRVEEILNIAIQTAEGLQEAHEMGIVHRDIKSANIMVNEKKQVKIMDFGLAKLKGQSSLTQEGTTVGTVAYMSPEQTHGNNVDQRSDIWSFGVVLYELISRQLPFKGEHEQAVIYSILNDQPKPLSTICSHVPPELERIVDKALAKDPAKRYQSLSDIQLDLKHLQPGNATISQVKPKSSASFPWNKTGLGLAVLMCLIIITSWLLMRQPFHKNPTPAPIDNSIAVMYFENIPQPQDKERLGDIITNLLITDLSESRYISVVSTQRLFDIMKLIGKEGIKRVDRTVASEVARRAKSRWMLTGTILAIEPKILITTQLIDVKSGRVVASQRVSGTEGQNLFALVDRLAVEVRKDLSLPAAATGETDRPVAEVTTHSTKAYRYYLEGYDHIFKRNNKEAEKSFRKAVKIDPTFAMAWYWLSQILDTTWGARNKVNMIAKAVTYSDRVSRKEKYYIHARAVELAGKPAEAISLLEKLLERFPDDKETCLKLGTHYFDSRQWQKALHYINRVIHLDPLYKESYNMLAYTWAYRKNKNIEISIEAANKYIALSPSQHHPYRTLGNIYELFGKLDLAIQAFKKADQIKPGYADWSLGNMYLYKRKYEVADSYYRKLEARDHTFWHSTGRASRALTPLHQGKLRQTLELLDEGIAADKREGETSFPYAFKYIIKAFVYMEMKKFPLALKVFQRSHEALLKTNPINKIKWEGYHAWFLGVNKRFDDIDKIVDIIRKDKNNKSGILGRSHYQLMGWCEFARGNLEAALFNFENSDMEEPNFLDSYLLGRIYLDTGRYTNAIKELRKAQNSYSLFRAAFGLFAGKIYFLMARAYEQLGQVNKATGKYRQFLRIWKEADPEIEELDIAKERLAKLEGGN